jgi:hypothetical protein
MEESEQSVLLRRRLYISHRCIFSSNLAQRSYFRPLGEPLLSVSSFFPIMSFYLISHKFNFTQILNLATNAGSTDVCADTVILILPGCLLFFHVSSCCPIALFSFVATFFCFTHWYSCSLPIKFSYMLMNKFQFSFPAIRKGFFFSLKLLLPKIGHSIKRP